MSTDLVRPGPEDPAHSRPADDELLQRTLAAAKKQAQTVRSDGARLDGGIEGAIRTHVPTQVDDRGWLMELFDPRSEWWTEPFAYAYATSVRPGHGKGWGLHKDHADRYTLLLGHAELFLYDVRPESPTLGRIGRYQLSEFDRGHLLIPAYVWHAMRNVGSTDVVVVNFPTIPFDHANPDKYTLPLNNDVIPFSFGETPGW